MAMPLALAVELAVTLLVLAVELADVPLGLAVEFATMLPELSAGAPTAKSFEGVENRTKHGQRSSDFFLLCTRHSAVRGWLAARAHIGEQLHNLRCAHHMRGAPDHYPAVALLRGALQGGWVWVGWGCRRGAPAMEGSLPPCGGWRLQGGHAEVELLHGAQPVLQGEGEG